MVPEENLTAVKPSAGLHDPQFEHDACGVAFVARLGRPASHEVVERGLLALDRLEHRGAEGADADTGDGAGILIQVPDEFFRAEAGVELPEAGRYGVAMCFLPRDEGEREHAVRLIERNVEAEGQHVLGWRDVPVVKTECGRVAGEAAPHIAQLFVGAGDDVADQDALERKLYVIRQVVEHAGLEGLNIPSFSSRTVVYKGMLSAPQLPRYYPDLRDERLASALALVHSRFSTNTFPSWELAHPYRMLAHNGEINTLRGNRNWMRAREMMLASPLFGDDIQKLKPLLSDDISDSASLDRVMELLVMGGRSPAHAITMMIPEAYSGRPELHQRVRDFYAYHSSLIEPWDGPAAVAFSDGRVIGATLDRNGLRPGRWLVTRDGWVVLASETGVFDVDAEEVQAKGRLRPGKLFLVDVEKGAVLSDAAVKRELAERRPYGQWLDDRVVHLEDLPPKTPRVPRVEPLRAKQLAFGWSEEDLRVLLAPMARAAAEPTASMGNDASLAVFSDRRPPLFSYFKQLFAQVTNPAVDPIRESVVMSLQSTIGPEVNLLDETSEHCHQLVMPQPLLFNNECERLRQVDHSVFEARTIDMTWPVDEGPDGMERRLDEICQQASELVAGGVNIIILSDRNLGPERAAIPSLLATAAVHHHLVREGTRLKIGLVVESGEAREVHHIACLIGYGASAVNPYVMFESLTALHRDGQLPEDMTNDEAHRRVVKAIGKGLLKILSKMGISTIRSYCGAQIFEAVGVQKELVDRHFTGTTSRVGGVGLDHLAREAIDRHARAYPAAESQLLPSGGVYAWRRDGEFHGWNPETVATLQHAARGDNGNSAEDYERFARYVNEEAVRKSALRGLLTWSDSAQPIDIDEVEPAKEIVKRFKSGGMSLGALSPEAHEILAVGMNRLGGKSNTGEGGEDRARFFDERRSSIKQVASGRFGVTIDYLVNSDEIQIKVAQGAKPGEGGQLPGHKVDSYIAGLRYSTPGVGLISPPPHHDIYSIEDLKQLIYDLRCANPRARISVKLVSEVGVGTVAAGVAKANADHVVIAGHDGGTGASPAASIQHAGVPWEIGLAETQQTLLANDLRSRIVVEVDGQMRTGRDMVIGAILGADEFGFSTAPLIALGCIMMRVCHLNTCPVGVATQDPVLRAKFAGQPEHVVNYLFMVAEEAREIMARLGVRDRRRADRAHRPPGPGRRGRPLEGAGDRPERAAGAALALARGGAAPLRAAAGPGQPRLDRPRPGGAVPPRHRERRAGRARHPHRQQEPGRRRPAVQRDRAAARHRGAAPGLDRGQAARLRRPELRRLAGARRDARARGRRQRLHRQGPVGRHAGRAPAPRGHLLGRGQRGDRQRGALRRHPGPRVLPRSGRRALRGAQLGRRDGGRGHRRPRLRVHDRRARGGPRADRHQLRRGHERRHRLRARRRRRLPRPLQPRDGPLRRDLRGRVQRAARRGGGAPRPHRLAGGRGARRRLGRRGHPLREGAPLRLRARAGRAGAPGGDRRSRSGGLTPWRTPRAS